MAMEAERIERYAQACAEAGFHAWPTTDGYNDRAEKQAWRTIARAAIALADAEASSRPSSTREREASGMTVGATLAAMTDAVEIDSDRCGGRPVLKGTRFTIAQMLSEMADTAGPQELADRFGLDWINIKLALERLSQAAFFEASVSSSPVGVTEELRKLSEAATPGEWSIFCEALMRGVMAPGKCVVGYVGVDDDQYEAWRRDAALIVAAVNYVRARFNPEGNL